MSIDMLPVELLTSIFEEVQRHEANIGQSTPYVPQWRVIRQVCKYWQEVADGHPKLWQTIDVLPSKRALHWVNLCLSKSGSAGLEVRFHAPYAMREACDVLRAHADRIQKISAWGEETIRGLRAALQPLFPLNLPNLQELHLEVNLPRTRDFYARETRFVLTELLGDLDPARLPALHSIRLRGIFLPWKSPIIPNLRVLHVDGWDANPVAFHGPYDIPLDRFLHVLASCARLETLSISVRNTDTHLRLPHGTLPIVSLPALRRLALTVNQFESRHLFAPVLAHIRLPPTCNLTLDGATSRFDLAGPAYADFLPAPALAAQSFPVLARAVAATWHGPTEFSCTSDSGAELKLAMRDRREAEHRALPDADDALAQFCRYLKEAPRLAKLTLRTCVSEDAYARAFRELAGLEELVVEYPWMPMPENVRALLSALAGRSGSGPEAGAGGSKTPSGSAAVLEGLRVLRLRGLVRYKGFDADVAECLTARREAGVCDVEVDIGAEG